jgi:hypothetical protein
MREIYLASPSATDSALDDLEGKRLDDSHYDLLLSESCRVYKPDGSLLLQLVKGAIPPPIAANAFQVLHSTRIQTSKNRSTGLGNEFKQKRILRDGSVSKTAQTIDPLTNKYVETHTGILGYYDRYTRYPYARETAFLVNYAQKWRQLQPFIRCVDGVFAAVIPDRYRIQKAIADACAQDWIIKGTCFSTLTVNKNFQIASHRDAGDLKEGFGVMAYLQGGNLRGGHLVIPKYRIGVRMESRDLLLFDVHELHGNTPIIGIGKYERITCVFYLRDFLLRCGNAAYEQERAKVSRQKGTLYDRSEIDRANQVKQRILEQIKAENNNVPNLYPQQGAIENVFNT